MKILFMTRTKKNWVGGDMIQLEKTAEALRKLGVEVDITEETFISPPEKLLEYDIVHLWNFSMIWTKYQLWAARKWKKPVVCSMIYHESDAFIPYPLQQIMLDNVEMAIFQTEGERERVKRHLTLDESKSIIIPNAIDAWWLEKCESRIYMQDFVLTVGRIEPSKGQVATAIACKNLNIPYVCIGEVRNEEYHKQLLESGAIWYDKMTREELKPWYFSAKVYIQPSYAETWSLATDEALSQGTQCVLTTMCERTDINILRCIHNDVNDIMTSIKLAWKKKDYSKRKKLKTWDEIAIDIKSIYDKIKS